MTLEPIRAALETAGWRVCDTGEVPANPECPYLLLFTLQPRLVRSMARPESARQIRFGITCVDLGTTHIEADADAVEALLEGSRILHPLARIELDSRGPTARDPSVTVDGAEFHTLPLTWSALLPKEAP